MCEKANCVLARKKRLFLHLVKKQVMAKKKAGEDTIVDVQEVYTKTELFIDRNRKVLTTVIGIAVVAFVAYFAYSNLVAAPAQEEAMESIWKAQLYMEQDSVEQARFGDGYDIGFDDVIEQHAGTNAAKLAHYYLGIIERNEGNFDLALDHFMQADFDDNTVGIIAMGNVGDMHVELENLEEGAMWLEKTAKSSNSKATGDFAAPFYYKKAGLVYMKLGDNAKALSMFEAIVDDYEGTSEYEMAQKLVGRLK